MFCKSCGSNIKDGVAFCPKCGSSTGTKIITAPAESGIPQEFQMTLPSLGEKEKNVRKTENAGKKRILVFAIALAVVIVAVVGISSLTASKYTIVGEWISTEEGSLVNVLANMLKEEGLNVDGLIRLMGLDGVGRINLQFTENGNMYLGISNVFPSVGSFTYEDLGGKSVMINYNLDVSAYGFGVPISLSYRAKYRIDKDGLSIDLFGKTFEFVPDTF